MAFRREVPALETLVLKAIAKTVRLSDVMINDRTLERLHRVSKPAKTRTHKVKQEIIRALLQGGRLVDDSLPDAFFHASMTRLEIIGAKITTAFVARVRLFCLSGSIVCVRLTLAIVGLGDLSQAAHGQLLRLLPTHGRRH